jgi:hypothetical protein
MNDEDERVTEFVEILSNAVDREAENKALRAQRDELLSALQNTTNLLEKLGYNADDSMTVGIARAAIAKAFLDSVARGKKRVRPSPRGPDSFAIEAARSAIAKAKGESHE